MRQVDAVEAALRVFLAPGQVCELRALHVGGARAVTLISGDVAALARRAVELDGQGALGVYFTPNPVRPDLDGSRASARKADVVGRRWLLIDVDPVRPADVSSTEDERRAAWQVLDQCRGTLDGAGLRGAVVGDSGNGWHLCYPVELPNDDAAQELVKGMLASLQRRCGTAAAQVDTKTFDAVRIWKLYGTRPRKGPPTAERPHRWTRLVEGPAWEAEAARANTALLPRLLEMWSWVEDRRRGRPETTAATYAAAALKQESEAVAGARPGGRNNRLNEAALKVGELVGAGSLDYEAAARCLYDAACRCGLDKDTGCGPDGIKATIRSGLAAGLKHPRDLSRVNGAAHANGTPRPNADTSDDPLDLDATAADLIQANVTVRWGWERWLPYGVLTVLASEPGVGKTRFCADLARRVYLGLPWPDGALPTFPRESRTLWVPADSQHAELATLTQSFGFPPEALYLNATRRNPFEGTMLDDPADLTDFEARIKRVRPALVFVDTSLNATDRSAHKPEDAKAFFVPLAKVAHRTGVVMLLVTHLNAAGKPLGRRIMGQARLVMQLEHPDPDKQPNRRKLYVVKSNSIFPPALGVTMADQGNEYDDKPPTGPEEVRRKPGPKPEAVLKLAEWLAGCLKDGPKKVHELRKSAEQAGHSAATLYAAKEHLELEQFEAEGKKWWKLTHDDQSP